MGIYLYGELANSKSKQLNKLALDTFEELKLEMDSSTVTNITELLSHLQWHGHILLQQKPPNVITDNVIDRFMWSHLQSPK